MLYNFARFLQFVGLVVLPVAIAGEVAGKMDLKESLSISTVGCLCFGVGWLIQQASKPR
jgi:hypothetical protein